MWAGGGYLQILAFVNTKNRPPGSGNIRSKCASLKRQVPLGRLARAQEDAQFALFLAGEESDFFVGQAIPFTGGWVQR